MVLSVIEVGIFLDVSLLFKLGINLKLETASLNLNHNEFSFDQSDFNHLQSGGSVTLFPGSPGRFHDREGKCCEHQKRQCLGGLETCSPRKVCNLEALKCYF